MRKKSERGRTFILSIPDGARNHDEAKCFLWTGCPEAIYPLVPDAGIWHALELVRRSRKHGAGLRWLRVQRCMARPWQVEGNFTVEDLSRIPRVRPGISGRNPDAPADGRRNGPARRRWGSRGGVVQADDGRFDSEPQPGAIPATQGLSRASDVSLDAGTE